MICFLSIWNNHSQICIIHKKISTARVTHFSRFTHLFRPSFAITNELPPLTIDAVYDTIQGLKVACKTHAVARFFEFNTVKSDKSRYTITCKANNCHWRLHAISIENSKRFRVRILSENHDCFAMNHVSHTNASVSYSTLHAMQWSWAFKENMQGISYTLNLIIIFRR